MPSLLFRIRSKTLAMIVALLAFCATAGGAEQDKGVLADLISKALSTPSTSVYIGAVNGVLSSDASISDIVLSDRDGPWLKIDKVRLIWSRLALLARRLEVDQLTIGHVLFLRRPLPSEAAPPPDATAPQSILPELPVKVIVKQFAVQELLIGEPVVGVEARLALAGKATLGPPSEGLDLDLSAEQLDAPGSLTVLLGFVPASSLLTLNVDAAEPAGGLFAHFAKLPGLPPVKLGFDGAGPLNSFKAKLDFTAGADVWANGQLVLARQDSARRLALDLKSRLEGLAPGIIRPIFAGETTLQGDVVFNDDSSVSVPGLHLVSATAQFDIEGGATADRELDLKVHAGAIPGAKAIGKLDLNASIKGPLSGPTLEAVFDAGQIRVAEGSLDHVAATFRAIPNGPLTGAMTRIAFTGDAKLSGLALADPALDQAVGPETTLTMRGAASPGGEMTFDALDLAAPSLSASFSGLLGRARIHGKLDVAARDLSRIRANRRRLAEGRGPHRRRSGRRAALRRAGRDPRCARDEPGERLPDPRQGHRRRTQSDRRRAVARRRRDRLHQSNSGRQARIRPAGWRGRARQGRSQRRNRCAAGTVHRPSHCRRGAGRRRADRRA